VNHRDLERRSRFYQSGIDRRAIEKGAVYASLPESFVIFVCNFDYFGRGLACYTRRSVVDGTDMVYDDGSHVIILNSTYQEENVSPAMAEFLDYVRNNVEKQGFASELVSEVIEKVNEVRNDETKEVPYMTFAMKMWEERTEGRMEGRMEGIITALKDFGASGEQIISALMKQCGLTREAAIEAINSCPTK